MASPMSSPSGENSKRIAHDTMKLYLPHSKSLIPHTLNYEPCALDWQSSALRSWTAGV